MAAAGLPATIEHAVRAVSTALKTARLYPPSSPIPQQSAHAAAIALADAFRETGAPVLPFVVARDGLALSGTDSPLGGHDVAELLAAHGIAEISFTPEVSDADVSAFFAAALRDPAAIRSEGGLAAVLEASGVTGVRVAAAAITVLDASAAPETSRHDDFLAEMARDPSAVTAWLESMRGKDPSAVAEGLVALAQAGQEGPQGLASTLARVFESLSQEAKDALLSASVKDEEALRAVAPALGAIDAGAIAAALANGALGANALSLSNALARLPLGQRLSAVLADVKSELAARGKQPAELQLLEHMLEVRTRSEPEPALADLETGYRDAARAAEAARAEIDAARQEVARGTRSSVEHSVRLMLDLLRQQTDFAAYCKTLEALATTVPGLIETRRLDLARHVLQELSRLESRADLPWPELSSRIGEAIGRATGPGAMQALLHAVVDDERAVPEAKSILALSPQSASAELVRAAIVARDPAALAAAHLVLGRRIADVAAALAPSAQWFEAGQIVALLLQSEDDPRAASAIEALASRPDAQTRQEVARSLGASRSPAALRRLASLARDPAPEVRASAIRSLGKATAPGAAGVLSALLDEIDCDGKDFSTCREIIAALERSPDPGSDRVLERLAHRKALIKRGHFADVTEAARQALAARQQGGGRA